ncbi:MAG: hypothetical protein EOQ42_00895 [Mesorhizobium sp.]|uniref:hypothetical protein n=1 Tax=Mesorhizobium sp. TaxID=1871066 RepID=UPI000FE7A7BA|nr:hypothetical protein [Mesorhizobium sp.]RWB32249.1 MAG: hypothetical protein EOQ43_09400 [Mesorhizobium sp.]RWB82958.1 MAG: hypothetical protein EOQ42_00895 [Mesorhizobium sp.]RWF78498.1 MAG: hypothetical protein EOS26_04910 [Mesorhizobium sp.]TIS68561.1 MAG: hypothetical protein E5W92_05025 [Mesorhizobium sp.]
MTGFLSRRDVLVSIYIAVAIAALSLAVEYRFFLIPSGLNISNTLLPWNSSSSSYLRAFAVAAGNSLAAGITSIVFCTLIGVALGIVGFIPSKPVNTIYRLYLGAFRNIPALFVVMLFYFAGLALPRPADALGVLDVVYFSNRSVVFPNVTVGQVGVLQITLLFAAAAAVVVPIKLWMRLAAAVGFVLTFVVLTFGAEPPVLGRFGFVSGIAMPIEFVALTIALSLYYSVEIAEVTRGSILSIDKGITDAGRALGLNASDRFRYILWPLALRFGLPSALNTYLVVLKATSLGVAIGFVELFAVTRLSIAASGRVIECLALLSLFYLTICWSFSLAANRLADRMKLPNDRLQGR